MRGFVVAIYVPCLVMQVMMVHQVHHSAQTLSNNKMLYVLHGAGCYFQDLNDGARGIAYARR